MTRSEVRTVPVLTGAERFAGAAKGGATVHWRIPDAPGPADHAAAEPAVLPAHSVTVRAHWPPGRPGVKRR